MSAASLEQAARRILGDAVGVGTCRIGERTSRALHHEELAQTGRMAPSRVLEFVAGRVAARVALGIEAAIPIGSDRAPVWPQGWFGSISHAMGWALAVTSRERPVGIDIEADLGLPEDIWDEVLLPDERIWAVDQPDPGRAARLIFCAKEAAYKAQYARSRTLFGFDRLQITVSGPTLRAIFAAETPPFAKGASLSGGWMRLEGTIIAGFTG